MKSVHSNLQIGSDFWKLESTSPYYKSGQNLCNVFQYLGTYREGSSEFQGYDLSFLLQSCLHFHPAGKFRIDISKDACR